jgi:hypothetical protein
LLIALLLRQNDRRENRENRAEITTSLQHGNAPVNGGTPRTGQPLLQSGYRRVFSRNHGFLGDDKETAQLSEIPETPAIRTFSCNEFSSSAQLPNEKHRRHPAIGATA